MLKKPYTEEERELTKNFLEMYYTFATNGKPSFGTHQMEPITEKLNVNMIISPTNVLTDVANASMGNSLFWTKLNIANSPILEGGSVSEGDSSPKEKSKTKKRKG
jgi:hypothetical protein